MFGKKKTIDATQDGSNEKKLTRAEKKAKKKVEKEAKKATGKGADKDKKNSGEKKRLPIKKIIIFLILLLFVGIVSFSVFFAYKKYFAAKDNTKNYTSVKLKYITLPDEIKKFTFDNFPLLYDSFINFNRDILLIDKEIARIKNIGQRYPDDKNIPDREEKIWNKARDKGIKSFKKIERTTETIYVLFQVNRKQGIEKIKESKKDLATSAKEALKPMEILTERLKIKPAENIPKGFIKGNIYKLRKKLGF